MNLPDFNELLITNDIVINSSIYYIKLEKIIRELNYERIINYLKSYNKIHTKEELLTLTDLNLIGKNIVKIERGCLPPNLINLSLGCNKIEKIENLSSFIFLKCLTLWSNNIKKIENLESLHSLIELSLSGNKIEKIENLQSLHSLTYLNLGYNKIKKIENLQSLHSLTYLYLYYNMIEKIENLPKSLKFVNLCHNRIKTVPEEYKHIVRIV